MSVLMAVLKSALNIRVAIQSPIWICSPKLLRVLGCIGAEESTFFFILIVLKNAKLSRSYSELGLNQSQFD